MTPLCARAQLPRSSRTQGRQDCAAIVNMAHATLRARPEARCQVDDCSFRRYVEQLGAAGCQQVLLDLQDQPDANGSAVTSATIRLLGVLFDALSRVSPQMLVVPIVPCAIQHVSEVESEEQAPEPAPGPQPPSSRPYQVPPGWASCTPASLQLPVTTVPLGPQSADHAFLAGPCEPAGSGTALQQTISSAPSRSGLPAAPHSTPGGRTQLLEQAVGREPCQGPEGHGPERLGLQDPGQGPTPQAGQQGAPAQVLQFRRVAAGGTFDRLHCGHELLLSSLALVATEKVFIGITVQKYSEAS